MNIRSTLHTFYCRNEPFNSMINSFNVKVLQSAVSSVDDLQ